MQLGASVNFVFSPFRALLAFSEFCAFLVSREFGLFTLRWVCLCAGTLLLLGISPSSRAADEMWPYNVQPGDTLIGIAQRILEPGASWQTVQRLNRIPNERRLVPGSTLQIPTALLRQTALTAEVVHTHGDVQVLRAPTGKAADAPPQAAAFTGGQLLAAGDTVRTGAQASAVLRFADGTRVMMRPDSTLKIERSARLGASDVVETQLRLEAGSVDSRVPKELSKEIPKEVQKDTQKDGQTPQTRSRFEIRTPMVHLGVRGTEFRTTATATQSSVEVLEGRVAGAAASKGTGKGKGVPASPSGSNAAQLIDSGFGTLATPMGVQPPRALLAAPDLRALPALVERLPMQLAWAALPGAAAYRAQVFSDATGAQISSPSAAANTSADAQLLLSGVFASTTSRWADDLPDGRYLFRVRAIDSVGLEGTDGTAAFTLKARPEPPFNTQPQLGERITTESLLLKWTRNPAAARYRVQVADTPNFAAPRVDRADLTDTELRLALPPGEHFWRVASVRDAAGAADVGPWGDARSFTKLALPAPPVSKLPEVTADGVVLAWNPGDATRFAVQVSADASFKTLLHDETVDGSTWLLRKPEPGSYFVRVRALGADGFAGPYGQPQQVDVARSVKWWWMLIPALVFLL